MTRPSARPPPGSVLLTLVWRPISQAKPDEPVLLWSPANQACGVPGLGDVWASLGMREHAVGTTPPTAFYGDGPNRAPPQFFCPLQEIVPMAGIEPQIPHAPPGFKPDLLRIPEKPAEAQAVPEQDQMIDGRQAIADDVRNRVDDLRSVLQEAASVGLLVQIDIDQKQVEGAPVRLTTIDCRIWLEVKP